jgi:signal transduction histidine kinase
MFKNLRTSTKLTLLCAMFIISIAATTYSLVAEKQIAIAFARKELIGSKFLETLRSIYATVLTGRPFNPSAPEPDASAHKMVEALLTAQSEAASALHTREIVQDLSGALSRLGSKHPGGESANAVDLLVKMQQLASRVGDSSNLTLDTDLDTYYLQNTLVDQLPKLLGRLGELWRVTSEAAGGVAPSNENKAYVLVLHGLIESTIGEIKNNLASAYRGNADESLKRAIDPTYVALFSATDAYLTRLKTGDPNGDSAALEREYETVVSSANSAWTVSQFQLDRLLQLRIDMLLRNMGLSLAMTGVLVGLSIVIAVMTYRHIVRPLERLEKVVSTVRETKNYDVRIHESTTNEIGRLASGFDEMLAELASARDRERLEQAELARVARLVTAGELSAAIAHEVAQPLTGMLGMANAAVRWLSKETPDIGRARDAMNKVVEAGHRADDVITNIRGLFGKGTQEKNPTDVNKLIRVVLGLVYLDLRKHSIESQVSLGERLPPVVGNEGQLQQVILNLVMNAIESMNSAEPRFLSIKSEIARHNGVRISIADTGTGITPSDLNRIFKPMFTTKDRGMGMGLSICKSIIESHNGRIWASAGAPKGSIFQFELPTSSTVH